MKVLIAGGGIGGLSAAVALLQRGIDVEVYEQAPELKEVGAGIQISPNGNKVLDALGVFKRLKELSCDPVRKEFRLWNTGKPWPMLSLGKAVIESYGYPYLTVYRPDLHQSLADRVRELKPDAIHLGCGVAGCEQDGQSATLVLRDGRRVTGDALIGADGVRSVVRNTLWGPCDPEFSGMVAWRGLIPMEELPEHMQVSVGSTWIGPGGHAVCYPLHRSKIMNFVATIEGKTWDVPEGAAPGTAEECLNDFAGWHEDVQTMIKRSPRLIKWALMQRDPIPRWTQGRISLLGDAAHATLPFLAQGAVHSIEDGMVLSRCLEGVDTADVAGALARYEAARIDRTSRMVRGATANTERFHSPELATEESAEKYLQREWSSEPIFARYDWLYSYDANTAPV
ncbi:FAD-dependent monooxygenase [Hydrogenophaga pseudoflava]|jgi:salicylate hydroxylase|uniref:FAD-dependent monooxygenase n=1 Tax=Hydrogenophaga pseudoflava TaxID=47421 RepID=UPI000826F616|nr:FAD-dependent monooxygenase [Hydrogenophaga pseudoflava]